LPISVTGPNSESSVLKGPLVQYDAEDGVGVETGRRGVAVVPAEQTADTELNDPEEPHVRTKYPEVKV
jgi:hypothetical protein